MKVLQGSIGTAVVKVSAVDKTHHVIEAPCKIFDTQEGLKRAFEAGELNCDVVVVVRFQGPAANGMPELHKLTPYLGLLQDQGYRVALLTDGRMSGASGKVLSAIHLSPEASKGGLLAYLQDGDVIRVDAVGGKLDVMVDVIELKSRTPAPTPVSLSSVGRGLFDKVRGLAGDSTLGASILSDFN
jgi:phosphogluconate dehydratase